MLGRDEGVINFKLLGRIMAEHKKQFFSIFGGCFLLAAVIAFSLPEEYQSTSAIRIKLQAQSGAAAVGALMGVNVPGPVNTYLEMLKSRSVLEPVIKELDLTEEDKEKISHQSFFQKYLDIKNIKNTDIIEITANGKTPEEAQRISNAVTVSFQKTLNRLKQGDYYLYTDFLNKRLETAKKEMETAELALEQFRQKVKVYVPPEQTKTVLDMLAKMDEQIVNLQVKNQTNTLKLQAINNQLEQQNAALRKYNLADNETIRNLREMIVNKKIALVEITFRYTDNHPDVIFARKEIEELEKTLKDEVEQSISAETNTLNPVQALLLKEKSHMEAFLLTDPALEDVLRQKQADVEGKMSQLSNDNLTYIGLERQVNISREMYFLIMQAYELIREQESLESMGFQVIDEAAIPKSPSAPNKLLFMAAGLIVGLVVNFCYLVLLYNKETHLNRQSGNAFHTNF